MNELQQKLARRRMITDSAVSDSASVHQITIPDSSNGTNSPESLSDMVPTSYPSTGNPNPNQILTSAESKNERKRENQHERDSPRYKLQQKLAQRKMMNEGSRQYFSNDPSNGIDTDVVMPPLALALYAHPELIKESSGVPANSEKAMPFSSLPLIIIGDDRTVAKEANDHTLEVGTLSLRTDLLESIGNNEDELSQSIQKYETSNHSVSVPKTPPPPISIESDGISEDENRPPNEKVENEQALHPISSDENAENDQMFYDDGIHLSTHKLRMMLQDMQSRLNKMISKDELAKFDRRFHLTGIRTTQYLGGINSVTAAALYVASDLRHMTSLSERSRSPTNAHKFTLRDGISPSQQSRSRSPSPQKNFLSPSSSSSRRSCDGLGTEYNNWNEPNSAGNDYKLADQLNRSRSNSPSKGGRLPQQQKTEAEILRENEVKHWAAAAVKSPHLLNCLCCFTKPSSSTKNKINGYCLTYDTPVTVPRPIPEPPNRMIPGDYGPTIKPALSSGSRSQSPLLCQPSTRSPSPSEKRKSITMIASRYIPSPPRQRRSLSPPVESLGQLSLDATKMSPPGIRTSAGAHTMNLPRETVVPRTPSPTKVVTPIDAGSPCCGPDRHIDTAGRVLPPPAPVKADAPAARSFAELAAAAAAAVTTATTTTTTAALAFGSSTTTNTCRSNIDCNVASIEQAFAADSVLSADRAINPLASSAEMTTASMIDGSLPNELPQDSPPPSPTSSVASSTMSTSSKRAGASVTMAPPSARPTKGHNKALAASTSGSTSSSSSSTSYVATAGAAAATAPSPYSASKTKIAPRKNAVKISAAGMRQQSSVDSIAGTSTPSSTGPSSKNPTSTPTSTKSTRDAQTPTQTISTTRFKTPNRQLTAPRSAAIAATGPVSASAGKNRPAYNSSTVNPTTPGVLINSRTPGSTNTTKASHTSSTFASSATAATPSVSTVSSAHARAGSVKRPGASAVSSSSSSSSSSSKMGKPLGLIPTPLSSSKVDSSATKARAAAAAAAGPSAGLGTAPTQARDVPTSASTLRGASGGDGMWAPRLGSTSPLSRAQLREIIRQSEEAREKQKGAVGTTTVSTAVDASRSDGAMSSIRGGGRGVGGVTKAGSDGPVRTQVAPIVSKQKAVALAVERGHTPQSSRSSSFQFTHSTDSFTGTTGKGGSSSSGGGGSTSSTGSGSGGGGGGGGGFDGMRGSDDSSFELLVAHARGVGDTGTSLTSTATRLGGQKKGTSTSNSSSSSSSSSVRPTTGNMPVTGPSTAALVSKYRPANGTASTDASATPLGSHTSTARAASSQGRRDVTNNGGTPVTLSVPVSARSNYPAPSTVTQRPTLSAAAEGAATGGRIGERAATAGAMISVEGAGAGEDKMSPKRPAVNPFMSLLGMGSPPS